MPRIDMKQMVLILIVGLLCWGCSKERRSASAAGEEGSYPETGTSRCG